MGRAPVFVGTLDRTFLVRTPHRAGVYVGSRARNVRNRDERGEPDLIQFFVHLDKEFGASEAVADDHLVFERGCLACQERGVAEVLATNPHRRRVDGAVVRPVWCG